MITYHELHFKIVEALSSLQLFYSPTHYTHPHEYSQTAHHLCRHRHYQHCCRYHTIHSVNIAHRTATIISTTTGMICSYFLNRRFTFKTSHRPIVQFICITITGLWILQPAVIWLLVQLLGITSTFGLSMAKLAATSISLMWNFVWYRIVFQGTKKKHLHRSVFSWLRQLGSNQRPIG